MPNGIPLSHSLRSIGKGGQPTVDKFD